MIDPSGPPEIPEIGGQIRGRQIQRFLPSQKSFSNQEDGLCARIDFARFRETLPIHQQLVFDWLWREQLTTTEVLERLTSEYGLSAAAAKSWLEDTVAAIREAG